MFRLLGEKKNAFLRSNILLNWTYDNGSPIAVVIPSVYSPRSGSSVDPAEKYSVDSTYTSPVIDPNSPFADLTPRVIIDHDGSGDRSTSNVSDKVVKDKMVLPTIEVTEVGEVEASRDKLTSEDGSAIEAADELKAEKIAEDASKKGELRELSCRVLDSRPRCRGLEPHRRHCVVVLEQDTFILA